MFHIIICNYLIN